MHFAKRIDKLEPYFFAEITRKIRERRERGDEVITFAIGDPDIPTPKSITDALTKATAEPQNHRYPETEGLPELRKAISKWYKTRFNVELDHDKEVLPLIGAKEGIGHVALCFIDPGDIALVPDPGYPVYSSGTLFAGGEPEWMPLEEKNNWLPDLSKIPSHIAHKAKAIWLNYPNNPTGSVATKEFFSEVVEFAKEYNIAILHDAPYTEIAYDNYKPISILEIDGSKEIAIEFHSLSKTYNMTGWRIAMAVGNKDMINALFRIKSNLDSGIPQAIQIAAIEALEGKQSCVNNNVEIYQNRRNKLFKALCDLGLRVSKPQAGLYLWARVPEGYTSATFTAQLLDDLGLVVTPGTGYGKFGEGYIRLSLTIPDQQLDRAITLLSKWNLPKASEAQ